MGTVFLIIVAVAILFGLGSVIFSDKADPKERAVEAAGAATTGAFLAGNCLIQLIVTGLVALAGIWVLGKLFGR